MLRAFQIIFFGWRADEGARATRVPRVVVRPIRWERDGGRGVRLIGGWQAAPMIAHVMLLSGDTARAQELLDLASRDIPGAPRDVVVGPLLDAQVAAVRGDAESAAVSLRRATELGWRGARWIRQSPVYDRVRADSAFAAALAEQERLLDGERREVERMLTLEGTAD